MFYDFKIWLDTPRDIRLARVIERNGEAARELWETVISEPLRGIWLTVIFVEFSTFIIGYVKLKRSPFGRFSASDIDLISY